MLRTFSPDEAPPSVKKLVDELLPRLLEGEHPALTALRAQLPSVRIRDVEWSGVGFFANLDVDTAAPLAHPRDISGGNAVIAVSGVPNGAGCVLFVRDGRLSCFESYSNGDDAWLEDAEVLSVTDVFPLLPMK